MWEADKIYYGGEDDFIKAFQKGKLIWSKVQELILFTDRDGLTYNGVELVPNQPNSVPIPIDTQMPQIPNGVTEVHWKNYVNSNIESLNLLNDGNKALTTFDAEGSNLEGITDMSYMFNNCDSLVTIPQLDTSNVTNMKGMFRDCDSLTTIPQLDTSNVTDMSLMFWGCDNLVAVPQLDTSNVVDMGSMFNGCINLTTIPQLDTSKVTDISGLFYDCNSLTTIPQLDTSKATNMRNMFRDCDSLVTIPQLNTSNVTNMLYMFRDSVNLTTIPQLDTSKVTDIDEMFENCSSLENVGGFIGLKVDLDMSDCPLTLDSVYNIANTVATVDGQTITLSDHTKALLNDEVREIFASKGWIIN